MIDRRQKHLQISEEAIQPETVPNRQLNQTVSAPLMDLDPLFDVIPATHFGLGR
jgi:hypothetical protein